MKNNDNNIFKPGLETDSNTKQSSNIEAKPHSKQTALAPIKNEIVIRRKPKNKKKHQKLGTNWIKKIFYGLWIGVKYITIYFWLGIKYTGIDIAKATKWIWDKFAEISWDPKYKRWFWKSFGFKTMWVVFFSDWIGETILVILMVLASFGVINVLKGAVGWTIFSFTIVMLASITTVILNKTLDLKLWRKAFAKKLALKGHFEDKISLEKLNKEYSQKITAKNNEIDRLTNQVQQLKKEITIYEKTSGISSTINVKNDGEMHLNNLNNIGDDSNAQH